MGASQKGKFIGYKLPSSIERLLGSTPFYPWTAALPKSNLSRASCFYIH
ncbi:hypothetical protein CKA32_001138 [Geitlerinema sp. FC II]|nr:hypothetical protein CKA32_001138 [Geitlerinema sp. FC II]